MSLASRLSFHFKRTVCSARLSPLPAVSAAQRARAIPDSLTDREFWDFFTTMSEEGGAFPSENFVSNEKTYQYVIPTLQRTLTPNGVYLGVGPEQNFTYIANLKPRLAVIFDIRRQNAMLHLMYKALFELSPSRAEFVSRLFSRPLPRRSATSATPAEIFDALATATGQRFGVRRELERDRRSSHGHARLRDVGRRPRVDASRLRGVLRGRTGHQLRVSPRRAAAERPRGS